MSSAYNWKLLCVNYFTIGSIYPSNHSHRHTSISCDCFFVLFLVNNKKKEKRNNHTGGWWRFSATPATRTLKISIFYPENRWKSQILLLVGSRHTSDDSPTVTQTSLSYLSLHVGFLWKNKKTTWRDKSTGEFPLCNARHKDPKNKCILPQK